MVNAPDDNGGRPDPTGLEDGGRGRQANLAPASNTRLPVRRHIARCNPVESRVHRTRQASLPACLREEAFHGRHVSGRNFASEEIQGDRLTRAVSEAKLGDFFLLAHQGPFIHTEDRHTAAIPVRLC
jgi:hypothetical protein